MPPRSRFASIGTICLKMWKPFFLIGSWIDAVRSTRTSYTNAAYPVLYLMQSNAVRPTTSWLKQSCESKATSSCDVSWNWMLIDAITLLFCSCTWPNGMTENWLNKLFKVIFDARGIVFMSQICTVTQWWKRMKMRTSGALTRSATAAVTQPPPDMSP